MSAAFEIEAKMVASTLSQAALVSLVWVEANPEECVLSDLADIRSGASSADMLQEATSQCCGDKDLITGWREYFGALDAHVAKDVQP